MYKLKPLELNSFNYQALDIHVIYVLQYKYMFLPSWSILYTTGRPLSGAAIAVIVMSALAGVILVSASITLCIYSRKNRRVVDSNNVGILGRNIVLYKTLCSEIKQTKPLNLK